MPFFLSPTIWRQLQRPLSITILMSSLLLLSVSLMCNTWYADWQLTHPIPKHTLLSSVAHAQEHTATVATSHLFGTSPDYLRETPITTLQLRLLGISKSSDEASVLASQALIAMGNQSGKLYRVGDHLPYGVNIYAITEHAVILQSDGHLEQLPLTRAALIFKPRQISSEA